MTADGHKRDGRGAGLDITVSEQDDHVLAHNAMDSPYSPANEPRIMNDEPILYEEHPAMFRSNPLLFILCAITVIPLAIWYLNSRSTTLIVTDDQTTLKKGLLSKHTNDVFHENVRNIQVKQSFFQRIMGVGYVGISSAGQSGVEIEVDGMPDPERIKQIIDEHRRS